ncbi:kinase-like domain-containing protein [Rhizophagus irregularis DAOM 181602=DAOM 197198]|nr:kinase-like domain-containing protein [Rhizophagus irregularis DAOM 181602=DAOM 197198]
MKKCWDEDPLKRPSSEEVLEIIKKWIYLPYGKEIKDIDEVLKRNAMEFINAPIEHNNLVTESHPQACYTSRLLNFTSKKLNEILESEMLVSEDLNDYMIKDLKLLDENTSKKLNGIPESEDSQASIKVNEMLVSEDLSECMVNLKSLDIKTD